MTSPPQGDRFPVVSPSMDAELRAAYQGRRVLVTGHTGFKGSWLTLWLRHLGAEVTGYALPPETRPALFNVLGLASECAHVVGDLRDLDALQNVVRGLRPEYVFHLAAQALVRRSYAMPLETLETNVMGTAHVLEALRREGIRCAAVMVTSDKCYENREWVYGYREDEPMGGHDVYSLSKGAAELVIAGWRRSFFSPERLAEHGVALASVRAGNVVGGGDWATDRIVPDAMRALAAGQPIPVRNPNAVRPWQHVLEPLGGYLLLGARLQGNHPERYCEAWNFGPDQGSTGSVRDVVEAILAAWRQDGTRVASGWDDQHDPAACHEAGVLRLGIEKARARLGWAPRWGFRETFARTVDWYRAHHEAVGTDALRTLCRGQIEDYVAGRARGDAHGDA